MQFFKIFNHCIAFSLFVALSSQLYAMDKDTKNLIIHKGPALKKNTNARNNDYFAKKLITKIQESYGNEVQSPTENSIFVNANILSYKPIAQELVNAHKNKVNITVLLSQKSLQYGKNMQHLLKKFPTYIYTNKTGNEASEDHAKLFLYDINGENGFSIGSSNLSSYGLFHNSEITHFIENDSQNYKDLLQNLQKILSKSVEYDEDGDLYKITDFSPLKLGKEGLKETPEKQRTVYSTLDKDFIALIINRLTPEKFASGDEIWLSTYTFNSLEITDAFCALLKMGVKVHMYIDKNPLTTIAGAQQIKKLVEHDAIVLAYILDSTQSYIHHAKFLLINRKGTKDKQKKKITIISTQNFLNSRAFDVLSLDQSDAVFDSMKKNVIDAYDIDKNFKTIAQENFDDIVTLAKKKSSKKRVFKELDYTDDTDFHYSQQDKKIKN